MSRRFSVITILTLSWLAVSGCRRDVARLDEVQKMAYSVKPAVVRISAYATGEFRYPASVIESVRKLAASSGASLIPRSVPEGEGVVDTGAGGSGSGFVIHPNGFILTSGHVVAPTRDRAALERDLARNAAIAVLVKHFPLDQVRSIYRGEGIDRYVTTISAAGSLTGIKVVNEVELSNGEKWPFRIERYSPSLPERGSDLALVSIRRSNLPSLHFGDSDTTRVGDSIWSVGYPAVASSSDEVIGGWLSRESDLEPTLNPGSITAIKEDAARMPVFQSNVAIYRGNSGGPAVDRNGDVIGVSTWGHTNAEQIKFLVPINGARTLLRSANVTPNVDGPFNQLYRGALDDAQLGRWVDAHQKLSRASALFANSPDLIRFRHDAERAVSQMPWWRKQPAVLMFAVVVVFASGVAVVALMLGRRRRRPKELLKAATLETILPGGGAEEVPQTMLGKFTILNGSRAGQKLGLGGSGIRIGRESTICEIVLENPKVSRLHAEVVSIDGKVLLIDRNSSNGTYVNDQKIDRRFLKDGDIIYFGGRNAVAVAFHA